MRGEPTLGKLRAGVRYAGIGHPWVGLELRFRLALMEAAVDKEADGAEDKRNLRSLLEDYERKLILLALHAAGGHQRRTAATLGVGPTTLSEKMRRLGLRQMRVKK